MRRVGLWPKHMGLKWGAIGNTLEKHIGNFKGTCWEQRKNEKKSPPTQHPKLKRKKSRHLECMLQSTHWLHLFIIRKRVFCNWPCKSLYLYVVSVCSDKLHELQLTIYTMQFIAIPLQLSQNNSFSMPMQLHYNYTHDVILTSMSSIY